ncbi:MAG: amino-acid N-acetyltransferase [Gammaproteobacteria bacterium]|nr:amino-acid N-acetyltransferase [Gammaproteobacteria bacterium]
MKKKKQNQPYNFVAAFRQSAPYIHAHRGKTFVLAFSGDAVADEHFPLLIQDLALLNSLGVRLVIVHGARPQIEQCLKQRKTKSKYVNGLRVTDAVAMECTRDVVGSIRVQIEALFSAGIANSPMAGAGIHVASGNFISARPYGIHDGVDFGYTGKIRKLDNKAILRNLDARSIVMLSPLAYSVTGEVFNVNSEQVATYAASAINADKLIFLLDGKGLRDARRQIIRQLTGQQAEKLLNSRRKLDIEAEVHLQSAIEACKRGVERVHLITAWSKGALLQELYTRDGAGTLVTASDYEVTRQAGIEDIGGIIGLIQPLEQQGLLVKRSREQLETSIKRFYVMERDGLITACAAVIPYPENGMAELACLAVHTDYRKAGRGNTMLKFAENQAKALAMKGLFVLTTQASHWFRERGFETLKLTDLPVKRRSLYNYHRKSRVYYRSLET